MPHGHRPCCLGIYNTPGGIPDFRVSFEKELQELAARHHFSSTESPVRAPFPAATAAPRSIQAGLGLLNPSPGQPPTTSNRPHIRREQRGSPVQLAQGGCSPKPLVPTQPQDPSARTPALQLHVARVHTCLRPCASSRVDLLRPSTSPAHAGPLRATENLPSRQTTRARDPIK